MNKIILSKKQCNDINQQKLEAYRERVSVVSRAKVYETDKEIADSVRMVPRDTASRKRYRSYSFSVQ